MPKFRVREGMTHGKGGVYGPGTVLEYSDYEAAGFLDKLELIEDAPAVVAAEVESVNAGDEHVDFSIEGLSVAAVLNAVDKGLISPADALEQEYAIVEEEGRDPRKSLVAPLAQMIAELEEDESDE